MMIVKSFLLPNKNLYKQNCQSLDLFEMFIFGILWKGTKILSRGDAETIEYLTRLVCTFVGYR